MASRKRQPLDALFDAANQKFFRGRLPKYRVVFAGERALGSADGRCSQGQFTIRIAERLKPDPARVHRTLLHEMCHHGCPFHGKRFMRKLERLAAMGEAWASKEIAEYHNSASWNENMRTVRTAVEDLARAKLRGNERTTFKDVTRTVGRDLGLPDAEVTHKIPWLKRCWENALATRESARIANDSEGKCRAQRRRLADRLGSDEGPAD
jgi:hypothetical protein